MFPAKTEGSSTLPLFRIITKHSNKNTNRKQPRDDAGHHRQVSPAQEEKVHVNSPATSLIISAFQISFPSNRGWAPLSIYTAQHMDFSQSDSMR